MFVHGVMSGGVCACGFSTSSAVRVEAEIPNVLRAKLQTNVRVDAANSAPSVSLPRDVSINRRVHGSLDIIERCKMA